MAAVFIFRKRAAGVNPRPTTGRAVRHRRINLRPTGIIKAMDDPLPSRKHLRRLEKVHSTIKPVVYFITICTLERKKFLDNPQLYDILIETLRDAADRTGWLVGFYTVMPDHIHFFCSPKKPESVLSEFIGQWKGLSAKRSSEVGHAGSLWQKEYFDHLIRSDESYSQKWEYVRNNPVRHGLCASADEWEYQGMIDEL